MSVTAEQRDAWVAALRSGRYRQGIGFLRQIRLPDGEEYYCCLGVLAHAVLGLRDADLLGIRLLRHRGCYALRQDVEEHLAGLNDCGMTFAQIADLLENADPALWA